MWFASDIKTSTIIQIVIQNTTLKCITQNRYRQGVFQNVLQIALGSCLKF